MGGAMSMTVGLCRVWLRLPENYSLKGKRQVLKSLLARLHNKFNVAAAEVDDHDSWQMASLGITCVTNDERQANQVMASVIAAGTKIRRAVLKRVSAFI